MRVSNERATYSSDEILWCVKNRVRWECEKTLCWLQVGSRASCYYLWQSVIPNENWENLPLLKTTFPCIATHKSWHPLSQELLKNVFQQTSHSSRAITNARLLRAVKDSWEIFYSRPCDSEKSTQLSCTSLLRDMHSLHTSPSTNHK